MNLANRARTFRSPNISRTSMHSSCYHSPKLCVPARAANRASPASQQAVRVVRDSARVIMRQELDRHPTRPAGIVRLQVCRRGSSQEASQEVGRGIAEARLVVLEAVLSHEVVVAAAAFLPCLHEKDFAYP